MDLQKIYDYVDEHKDEFIEKLKVWIRVKSVSAVPEFRQQCFEIADLVAGELKAVGCDVNVVANPLGKQKTSDGREIDLPPVVLASYGHDPSKKTACIYGHLDVQPADKSDGWKTDPFELHVEGDEMYGRGATDDKGPVLGWLCMLQAMKELSIQPNINIKFVLECMEESGCLGLRELIEAQKDLFLKDIDFIAIIDCFWLGTRRPSITYGLRGMSYFYLEVSGPGCDLHSGVYGGTVREPMTDLLHIMSKLVDPSGKILVPGIYDQVAPVTEEEKSRYEKVDFELPSYASEFNCTTSHLLYDNKVDCLMHRWRFPSLSLHGVEGAFSQPGAKTVIPSKVIGKFSIRSVPNMVVEDTHNFVNEYIKKLVAELQSPNHISLIQDIGAPSWIGDITHHNYVSACKAAKAVYGVEADLTREGASVPVTVTFAQVTGKNVIILPVGKGDDAPHSEKEKFNVSNFMYAIKFFATYLNELASQE